MSHQIFLDDQALMEVVFSRSIRAAVTGVLGSRFRNDIDDVLQETFISAQKSLPNFDGQSLNAWIATIARRRAKDLVLKENRRMKQQGRFELEATSRVQSAVNLFEEDFSATIDSQQEATTLMGELIGYVESFVQNQAACSRALELITTYADDVSAAARAMTISEDALRACRRDFVRCAVVISRALDHRKQGSKPTLQTLVSCMPGEGESGEWVAPFVIDVLASGGFNNTDLQALMERTGMVHNTVRQYLKEAQWLMRVAFTVLTSRD